MKRTTYALGSALLLVSTATASAAASGRDWPHWAGPNFDLTVDGAGAFDREVFGLERAWIRPLGSAYSGIAVVGDKLVTAFSDGTDDLLVALDAATGEELWRYRIGDMYKGHDGSHDGPNGTPLVYGGRVYGLGPSGHLFAVGLEDGEEIFAHKVDGELGGKAPQHGFTTAPTVVGGVLVVQTGGPDGHSISAFDLESGELRWQTADDSVDYQSPLALEIDGRTLVLAVTNESVLGLEPESGEVLFRHAHPEQVTYRAAQPVPLGGGKVLLPDQRGAGLYQVEKGDDGYRLTELWRTRSLRGTYTVPVPYEGYLYGYSGSFLTCVDAATGETVWKSRPPGRGNLVLIDGHLVLQVDSGEVVVAEASPEGYEEKARVKALDEGYLTAPSFAGGRVYVRNLTQIASVGVTDRVVAGAAGPPQPEIEVLGELARFVGRLEAADAEAREAMIAEFLESQERFPIVEGDRWVHFVYHGEVDDLALAGNFYRDGEKVMGRVDGTDFYYRSVEVDPGAHYIYRFQVFEEPKLDPLNPRRVEDRRRSSSELAMPGWPEPKHIEEPEGERGRLETVAWASAKLEGEREVQVYLPPGYDASEERYPLIVVNAGDEALEYGLMANSLDNLIGKKVAPVVAAFVPSEGFREYGSPEGLASLTEAMVSELLPMLESKYRTIPERGARAIVGNAFGASHAVYAALAHPEVFGRVAVQSYIAYRSKDAVAAMIGEGKGEGLAAYVEFNTNDVRFGDRVDAEKESRELARLLEEGGAELTTHEVADGPDWSSWRSRTDLVLAALFPQG